MGCHGRFGCAAIASLRSPDIVLNDLAALHHKLDSLKFSDIRQWIAGDSDQIGVFALVDGSDPVMPSHHFGVNRGPALNGRSWTQAGAFHEPLKIEGLR